MASSSANNSNECSPDELGPGTDMFGMHQGLFLDEHPLITRLGLVYTYPSVSEAFVHAPWHAINTQQKQKTDENGVQLMLCHVEAKAHCCHDTSTGSGCG